MTRTRPTIAFVGALALAAALAAETAPAQTLKFRRVDVNPESNFEAAGVADIDGDGLLDVVCGDTWYAGPDWTKRHRIMDIPEDGGYRLDFANVPMDVNGDGRIDVVSNNWHAMSVVWRANPGPDGGDWPQEVVDRPGNQETAIAVDVDGDGRLDFLPDVAQNTVWYRLEEGKLVPRVVSAKIGGHGIGFGDVNGDGRADIVKPGGWFEAPEDRLNGEWLWRPEWNMGGAGISIVVHDFTGDGLADLFWGNGHDYGRFWLEQTRETDPASKWIRHEVDMDWSQAHALVLADLNGDGDPEVVTGKRYYAHNGHDPGAEDPMIVCAYFFDKATKTFRRETIHEGGKAGLGLAPVVIDLDGDGDLDIVGPGKSGLYVHLQETAGGPLEPEKSASLLDVRDGFEATLFAAEPMIRKAIAMDFDERGRMVICEAAMYPLGPPPGEAPSDTVKILEDADGDGRADAVKIFADGLNIPDAVAVGHGGIYVAEAPNVWFMRDTDGDDRADEKRAILTGFGTQDSHHNVHGLVWDPSGRLVMNQGCSTTSRIRAVGTDGAEREWDLKEGDFFRSWPDGTGFEIVFKGFTNSWGYDWDEYGNWVCNDNEGPHLIHLVEGADYGFSLTNRHPGERGALPGVERDYGDARGYLVQSGLTFQSGTEFPEELRGRAIQGAPKLHRVIVDTLAEKGASFVAFLEDDLAKSADPWTLPIHMRIGPDGALYFIDWYNEILAHVEHPLDSAKRDKTRGRIYRIAWKDAPKRAIPDLRAAGVAELAANLRDDNKWTRRTSQRLLAAKGAEAVDAALAILADPNEEETARTKCHAIWTLEETRRENDEADGPRIREAVLAATRDEDSRVRAAAFRTARRIGLGCCGDDLPGRFVVAASQAIAGDANGFVRFEAAHALARAVESSGPDLLTLDDVAGFIAGADWNDPFLAYAFGKLVDPFREPILNRAFTIGARGLNGEGAALLPALVRMEDPRVEPLLIATLSLPELEAHRVERVVEGLRAFPGARASAALVDCLTRRPDLPAPIARGILNDLRERDFASGGRERAAAETMLLRLAEGRDDSLLRDVFLTAGGLRATLLGERVRAAFAHPDPRVAEAATIVAADVLVESEPRAAARADLEARFVAAKERARWAALRGLSGFDAPSASLVDPLLDSLADPDLATDAVAALRRIDAAALARVMERVASDQAVVSREFARRLREWIDAEPDAAARERYRATLVAREGILRDWLIAGPFPNADTKGHAAAYPPELALDANATFESFGKTFGWTKRGGDGAHGLVQLMDLEPNERVVAYGWTTFDDPEGGPATLLCGSDDSIRVWVNGRLVHDNLVDRGLVFDQDRAEIVLAKGRNDILVKCGQNGGGWNFHARIVRPPAAVRARPDDPETVALHGIGEATRGEALFFGKASCARCHAFGDRGGRVGPDLTRVADFNPKSHIVRSILNPSEEIAEGFGGVTIATTDGQSLDGYVRRESPTELELVDAEGKSRTIAKSAIAERTNRSVSGMPEDFGETLTAGEVADLVAFLTRGA